MEKNLRIPHNTYRQKRTNYISNSYTTNGDQTDIIAHIYPTIQTGYFVDLRSGNQSLLSFYGNLFTSESFEGTV